MATGNDNESPRRAMSTAEVLVSEFKLLHGEAAWTDLTTTPAATKFAEDAAASARDENGILNSWLPPGGMIPKEELRNLALHAFAVRSLTAERGNEPVNQEKLDEVEKDPGQTALCLSGGGIRSAAFALGVLQGCLAGTCSTSSSIFRPYRAAATLAPGSRPGGTAKV